MCVFGKGNGYLYYGTILTYTDTILTYTDTFLNVQNGRLGESTMVHRHSKALCS